MRKVWTDKEAAAALKKRPEKLPRINIAFEPESFEYLKTMSRVMGLSQTELVNQIISKHKEEHIDLYNKALEFRDSLK